MQLQAIAANIWVAWQPLRFLGLAVGSRMTVIRLEDGRLVVISPIALTPDLMEQIDALGAVAYLIAPNRYHHLFAQPFKQQYPQAQFLAAMGLQEKCPHLAIDRVLHEAEGTIDETVVYQQFPGIFVPSLAGADPLHEIVFWHRPSRTLIITDIAFHFDRTASWEAQLVGRFIGGYNQLQKKLKKIKIKNLNYRDK